MTAPFIPMTKEAVAAVLDCTTRTIENMLNSGELPKPVKIAGRVFWHPEVFYTWLDSLLRGGANEKGCDIPRVPPVTPEIDKLNVPARPIVPGKNSNPAARMKARQAALLALP